MMILCDGHAHPGQKKEHEIRQAAHIMTFLCASNPDESPAVDALCAEYDIYTATHGLHPWYADRYQVKQMQPFIEKARILGEIGMDNVWCEVPLKRQQEVFEEQLSLAAWLGMPVILHTKGQEREILELIKPYETPFVVHWYSCAQYQEDFIKKGCYFTIGPDLHHNPEVRRLAVQADIDRLLVETDGWNAVKWAKSNYQQPVPETEAALPELLYDLMEEVAKLKGMRTLDVVRQMHENYLFLKNYREM